MQKLKFRGHKPTFDFDLVSIVSSGGKGPVDILAWRGRGHLKGIDLGDLQAAIFVAGKRVSEDT